jgi:hypothetical protein
LCAPEATIGLYEEKWRITSSPRIQPGDYEAEAFFLDNSKLAWAEKSASRSSFPPLRSVRVSLGELKVEAAKK